MGATPSGRSAGGRFYDPRPPRHAAQRSFSLTQSAVCEVQSVWDERWRDSSPDPWAPAVRPYEPVVPHGGGSWAMEMPPKVGELHSRKLH